MLKTFLCNCCENTLSPITATRPTISIKLQQFSPGRSFSFHYPWTTSSFYRL